MSLTAYEDPLGTMSGILARVSISGFTPSLLHPINYSNNRFEEGMRDTNIVEYVKQRLKIVERKWPSERAQFRQKDGQTHSVSTDSLRPCSTPSTIEITDLRKACEIQIKLNNVRTIITQPSLYLYYEGCVIVCGYLWVTQYVKQGLKLVERKWHQKGHNTDI